MAREEKVWKYAIEAGYTPHSTPVDTRTGMPRMWMRPSRRSAISGAQHKYHNSAKYDYRFRIILTKCQS